MAELVFGKVVGHYRAIVGDTLADTDVYPDIPPLQGTITFSPTVLAYIDDDTSGPTTYIGFAVPAVLDSEGYVSRNGVRGVWLHVGEYSVSFNLNYMGASINYPGFNFTLTAENDNDSPYDLTSRETYNDTGAALTESTSEPGTYSANSNYITESTSDPGTYTIISGLAEDTSDPGTFVNV